MGHVNNANHLTYVELSRIKYFEEVTGFELNWNKKQGIILAHNSIDYKAPLFINDIVFVYTGCSKLGKKSLELSWLIVRERPSGEEIVAQGHSVLVFYDYASEKSIEIPDIQRKKIMDYESLLS